MNVISINNYLSEISVDTKFLKKTEPLKMTSKPQINITIDDRERNPAILNCLRETENSSMKIDRLANGDYLLNNLTVERKTSPDFVQSIKDGRLFQQASCLSSLNNPCMMILEGTFKDVF